MHPPHLSPNPPVWVRRGPLLRRVLGILGLLLYAWVMLWQTRLEFRRDLEQPLQFFQQQVAQSLAQWERSLHFVISQMPVADNPVGNAAAMVQALRLAQPQLREAAVLLANGDLLWGDPADARAMATAFAAVQPGQGLQLSRPYPVAQREPWRVALRVALTSYGGTPGSYLVVGLPLQDLGGTAGVLSQPDGLALELLRDDGFLQGRWPAPAPEEAGRWYGNPRSGALRQYLLEHPETRSGYVEGFHSAEDTLYAHAFVRLEGLPLTLQVAVPLRTLVGQWAQRMVPALLVVAAMVLLGWPPRWFRRRTRTSPHPGQTQSAPPPLPPQQTGEALLSHVSFGVATHAANGALIYCNPEAERLLGLSRDQLHGRAPIDAGWCLLGSDGSPLDVADYPLIKVLRTGAAISAQLVGVQVPGGEGIRWLMGDATPMRDGQGNLLQVVVTFMDVTPHQRAAVAHRLAEQRYRDLVQGSLHAVVQYHPSGGLGYLNPAALQLFGLSADAVGRKHISQLVDVHDPRFLQLGQTLAQQGHAQGETVLLRDGEQRFEAQVSLNAHTDAAGQTVISMMALDISERQRVLNALRASEERMKGIVDSAMDAIICVDEARRVLIFNASAQRMFGYAAEEMIGNSLDSLLPTAMRDLNRNQSAPSAQIDESRRSVGPLSQFTAQRRDGSTFPIEASISQLQVSGQRLLTIIVRDVTSRVQSQMALEAAAGAVTRANAQLEHLAHFDTLTGLPNRVLLVDRLRQAMLHCQRHKSCLAVALLDIDGFMDVNERMGHAAGDQLLVVLAQRMKLALRNEDTLARIGGDEFVVLVGELQAVEECEPVLQRLLSAIAEPLRIENQTVQVSCSIGVTLYPRDGAEADTLLRHADQAMYLAKESGKARYVLFDVAQEERKQVRSGELEAIRLGLQRQEFRLHYQPKVNLQTGAVVGCEALIRWQHPQKGLLLPGRFLPLIEDDRIHLAIGEWVIETALQQMQVWAADGLSIAISVNVGAEQLQSEGFTAFVAGCIARHPGLARECLEFEVLETSALEDIARVSQVMQELRALGIRFALDDFGTGYSSLTYLKSLPAQQLKVDQSFVRDMLVDRDDRAIVQGVVSLAHAFELEVIAEGVETDAHGEELLAMGCLLAQGYGIARPMPAEQLPDWIAHWEFHHCAVSAEAVS